MKVLDLQCSNLHSFEGWFGSEAEFQSQLASGLVNCPLCGASQVVKKLSAPRLNLSGATVPNGQAHHDQGGSATMPSHDHAQSPAMVKQTADANGLPTHLPGGLASNPELQALFVRAVREIIRQTEDVGDQFADQARRMHHGEQEAKAIRGQATPADTLALLEEGIDVMPLPHLPGLKETLQ